MIVKNRNAKFTSEGTLLTGVIYKPVGVKNPPGVLFLHGGGQSSKERYRKWQDYLCKLGISSFAFNFRGVGESKGNFFEGSLKNRFIDSVNALNFFLSSGSVNKTKVGIVGSSMGAPVALKLCSTEDIKTLILVSAAAYSKEAEDKLLTPLFTRVIRKKNSWHDSSSFQLLKRYKGSIMIIYGSKDSVIPEGVKRKYKSCLGSGNFYEVIENGLHTLLDPKDVLERKAFKELLNKSTEFLLKNLV